MIIGIPLNIARSGNLQPHLLLAVILPASLVVALCLFIATTGIALGIPNLLNKASNLTNSISSSPHHPTLPSANKQSEFTFVRKWTTYNDGNGPHYLAIDTKTSNLYVTYFDNYFVEKFTSDGKLIGKWGSPGTGDGQFNAPTDVAVDPKTNNVYVTDRDNNRIQVFTPAANG